jgi:predicted DNA-binding antitoxin AbrB/MazE fold protein
MQAVKAYYDEGKFVPLGLGKLPEGTQAIITVLDEPLQGIEERLKAFDDLCKAIDDAVDEEMPPLEPIRFREVEI